MEKNNPNTDEPNDDNINDSQSYSTRSDFSKASVVSQSITTCFNLRSVEMKKGYFNFKVNPKTGEETKTWVSDSRKNFISSVDGLRSILYPECLRDISMKNFLVEFDAKKKKLQERFYYKEEVVKRDSEGRLYLIKTGASFLPEEDFVIIKLRPIIGKGLQKYGHKGLWNLRTEIFWTEMIPLYDELFAQLNLLCDKNDYFTRKVRLG